MKAAVCIGVLHRNCLDSQHDGRKILISGDRLSHPENRRGFKVIFYSNKLGIIIHLKVFSPQVSLNSNLLVQLVTQIFEEIKFM